MKGTSVHRIAKRWSIFWRRRGRLLVLLALFAVGFVVGCSLFLGLSPEQQERLAVLLTAGRDGGYGARWISACLYRWLMMAVLLLASVSACGLPFVMAMPVAYGLYGGLAESYWYAQGQAGLKVALLQLALPSALQMAAVLMACAEASRMTVAVAARLLPGQARGDLWPMWRLCMLRFALFFGLSTISAALEAVMG